MKYEQLNINKGNGHPTTSEEHVGIIQALYGVEAAKAILFLLSRADSDTSADFLCKYVYLENLNYSTTVDIIIRPLGHGQKMRGNLGRYVILLKKEGGAERQLSFTNQASMVYYLMYLIDRYQKGVDSANNALNLATNKNSFLVLYKCVYDIDSLKLVERFQRLLYREDRGVRRVGREAECIYDIRKHLEKAFVDYGESFFPYAMTAKSHITINPSHIFFEEGTEELLKIQFV